MTVLIDPLHQLRDLLEDPSRDELARFFADKQAHEVAYLMSHLNRDDQMLLLTHLTPADAALVMEEIPESQAVDIVSDMTASDAADILNEMPSDEQVDILSEVKDVDAEAIISLMDPEEAADVRRLIRYESDTAGGLMVTEFLVFSETSSVIGMVEELKVRRADYEKLSIKYLYIVNEAGRFAGVLQMQDLVFSPADTLVRDIIIPDVLKVGHHTTLDELIDFFHTYDFYGVPVIDDNDFLLGVVLRKDVLEEAVEQVSMEHLESQGIVGGEELRTMPIWTRASRRLSWLSINIILNMVAASVIAFHQDTLSAVIALAVFLPIISDMSGCSGNQAVAVSMRELSLGVVKPKEVLRVWMQELSVGLINGTVLGMLLGLGAYFWQGNIALGFVVGGALCLNTILAVSLGGTVPLLLKKGGVDPALASGPILTTVTDMAGFFLTLTFAGWALGRLL
ncbi:MAG: magnesium transporter [Saprospiraceae bacterium]|nr:magnesium transporter [Saprospiraceae bacterium]